ncbi:MAG: family 1 glycosylhydrolase [Thermodesulfobacteriota bacterium]
MRSAAARCRPSSPLVAALLLTLVLTLVLAAGCSDAERGAQEIHFADVGPLAGEAGRGGFRFGAASAATQIEDGNPTTDWWVFTAPPELGGLGRGTFVGEASRGYTLALDDVRLLEDLRLDAYRFSIEWARVEPERDAVDEAALAHYDALLDRLLAAGIRPNVTLHHFSNPVWVDDPRDVACAGGPSDANLCGLGHPAGGPQVIAEMAEHARLLAARYGDRVDDWGTLNEPINYLLAAYGIGTFPPGKAKLFRLLDEFIPVVRDYLDAHAAMYRAIREADTIDADGDGVAAAVGLTLAVVDWVAARDNALSSDPQDLAARDRLVYAFHHLAVDSLRSGTFDADLDGTPDEEQPGWRGTLDWLGAQYYFRAGVTGENGIVPVLELSPCFAAFDLGACVPPIDPTFCVPAMGYETYAPGLYGILRDLSGRWPDLPLVVTESGIATEVGARRAENVVRTLEEIARARRDGVDVRGYYHWSLFDNFEWAEGFVPRFGLYLVDYATYARIPTGGATVLGEIARTRTLTDAQRERWGGEGPMTPEPSVAGDVRSCTKEALGEAPGAAPR